MSTELVTFARACRNAGELPERVRFAEEVVTRVGPPLKEFLPRLCRTEDVDDVYQETLIAIAVNLPNFRGSSDRELWSWCYQVARNKSADRHRWEGRHPTVSLDIEEIRRAVETRAAPSGLSEEDRLALDAALGLLGQVKPPCVEYLHAYFILDMDYPEMAAAFASRADAMRMRVNRCLELANELLAQHG